MNQLETFNTCF